MYSVFMSTASSFSIGQHCVMVVFRKALLCIIFIDGSWTLTVILCKMSHKLITIEKCSSTSGHFIDFVTTSDVLIHFGGSRDMEASVDISNSMMSWKWGQLGHWIYILWMTDPNRIIFASSEIGKKIKNKNMARNPMAHKAFCLLFFQKLAQNLVSQWDKTKKII